MIEFTCEDCMQGMKRYPDKFFDLAIVDPPYFSGPERRHYYGRSKSKTNVFRSYNPSATRWVPPTEEYFRELMRVSKHYIVWGCNYFDWDFAPGRIVWDKCNGNSTFSDAEIAATDLFSSVRLFPYLWNGMFQRKSISEGRIQRGDKSKNEKRIHPTQKPVNLYLYLLQKYAKPGDRILDTHVGSGSSLIACEKLGFDCVGFEIDKAYFEAAQNRIDEEMAQIELKIWPTIVTGGMTKEVKVGNTMNYLSDKYNTFACEAWLRSIEANLGCSPYSADFQDRARETHLYIIDLKQEIDALLADLKEADLIECNHCVHFKDANPIDCDAADWDCGLCEDVNCKCKNCRDNSNWEWRGMHGD